MGLETRLFSVFVMNVFLLYSNYVLVRQFVSVDQYE